MKYHEIAIDDSKGFFDEKMKKELDKMKEFLSIINEWVSSSYVIINWKRFTIWDMINVFVDPFNSNNYYLEI